jgi:hypothetical protein
MGQPQVVLASRTAGAEQPEEYMVVRTPLDLIQAIDLHCCTIETVILADVFASDADVDAFLRADYPWLSLVAIPSAKRRTDVTLARRAAATANDAAQL